MAVHHRHRRLLFIFLLVVFSLLGSAVSHSIDHAVSSKLVKTDEKSSNDESNTNNNKNNNSKDATISYVETDATTGAVVSSSYSERTQVKIAVTKKAHARMVAALRLWRKRTKRYRYLSGVTRVAKNLRENALKERNKATAHAKDRYRLYKASEGPVQEAVKCIKKQEAQRSAMRRKLTRDIIPSLNREESKVRWFRALMTREMSLKGTHAQRADGFRKRYNKIGCSRIPKTKMPRIAMMEEVLLQLTPKPLKNATGNANVTLAHHRHHGHRHHHNGTAGGDNSQANNGTTARAGNTTNDDEFSAAPVDDQDGTALGPTTAHGRVLKHDGITTTLASSSSSVSRRRRSRRRRRRRSVRRKSRRRSRRRSIRKRRRRSIRKRRRRSRKKRRRRRRRSNRKRRRRKRRRRRRKIRRRRRRRKIRRRRRRRSRKRRRRRRRRRSRKKRRRRRRRRSRKRRRRRRRRRSRRRRRRRRRRRSRRRRRRSRRRRRRSRRRRRRSRKRRRKMSRARRLALRLRARRLARRKRLARLKALAAAATKRRAAKNAARRRTIRRAQRRVRARRARQSKTRAVIAAAQKAEAARQERLRRQREEIRRRRILAERERKRRAAEERRRRIAAERERRRKLKIQRCMRLHNHYVGHAKRRDHHARVASGHSNHLRSHMAKRNALRSRLAQANAAVRKFTAQLGACRAKNAAAVAHFKRMLRMYQSAVHVRDRKISQHRLARARHIRYLGLLNRALAKQRREAAAYKARRSEFLKARTIAMKAVNAFHRASMLNAAKPRSLPAYPNERVWRISRGRRDIRDLSVNLWNQAYVVTRARDIERFAPEAKRHQWLQLPGGDGSAQVQVDCNGNLWKLDTRGRIWSMSGRSLWKPLRVRNRRRGKPFAFSSISIGAGNRAIWGIARGGERHVFRYDPDTETFVYQRVRMSKISVACDGDVWGISPGAAGRLYHLAREGDPHARRFHFAKLRYRDLTGTWVHKGNYVRDVAVSLRGVYALGRNGVVFHYNPPTSAEEAKTTHWVAFRKKRFEALAAAADGTLFALTAKERRLAMYSKRDEDMPRSYQDFLKVKRKGTWARMDAGLGGRVRAVTAGKDGTLFAVTRLPDQVLEYNFKNYHWRPIPGANLRKIARACDGTTVGIDSSHSLVGFVANNGDDGSKLTSWTDGKWVKANSAMKLRDVAVCGRNEVYGINGHGNLIAYWPERGMWHDLDVIGRPDWKKDSKGRLVRPEQPKVVSIDCGCEGHLLLVDNHRRLWSRLNGRHDKFDMVAKGVAQVSVGREVYIVDPDHRLFRFNLLPRIGTWGKDTRWEPMFTRMRQISVGALGQLYGRDLFGDTLEFRPSHVLPSWVYIDGRARSVRVGNRHSLFAFALEDGSSGKRKGTKNDGEGTVLVKRNFEMETWDAVKRLPVGGALKDITVGCDATTFALTDGDDGTRIWKLDDGNGNIRNGEDIDPDATGSSWTEIPSNGPAGASVSKISVGHHNELWGINAKGGAPLQYNFVKHEWIELGGTGAHPIRDISVGCDGTVWAIGKADSLPYRFSMAKGQWQKMSDSRVLSVTAGKNAYVISAHHRVFRFDEEKVRGRWVSLSQDHLFAISAGGDGALYGVDIFNRIIEISPGIKPVKLNVDGTKQEQPTDGVPPPAVTATTGDTTMDNGLPGDLPDFSKTADEAINAKIRDLPTDEAVTAALNSAAA